MTKSEQKTPTLGLALLGLIKMNPSTGYELRSIFQQTAMSRYSSSPGAIYPALRALESRGLIRCRDGVGKTRRPIQTWHCTAVGTQRLNAWLRMKVTPDEVYKELDVALLRFSYFDLLNDIDWSIEFLKSFGQATNDCCTKIEALQKSLKAIQPIHGQCALSNGVQIYKSHARWAEKTIVLLEKRKVEVR